MSQAAWSRPTRAYIQLGALAHNARLMRSHLGSSRLLAVLKADAYGHGAVACGKKLSQIGLRDFGVATLEEALELRRAGLKGSIILLGALEPSSLGEAARARVGITIWNRAYLQEAARASQRLVRRGLPLLQVHLKVDTGMIRLGLAPDEVPEVLELFRSRALGHLKLGSAYTHFACADDSHDRASLGQFLHFLALPWPMNLELHAANSAAALRYRATHLSYARCGLFLYGASDSRLHAIAKRQQPVLSLQTRVLRVTSVVKGQGVSYGHSYKAKRPTRIATLAIGYADGVPRYLSNQGRVLIKGKSRNIVGRVCMDLLMVELGSDKLVKPGDEAMLLGRQAKSEIRAAEWAQFGKTNVYEVLCGIRSRVPRVYLA